MFLNKGPMVPVSGTSGGRLSGKWLGMAVVMAAVSALSSIGCNERQAADPNGNTNGNTSANSNAIWNANAAGNTSPNANVSGNTNSSASTTTSVSPVSAREPDRYQLTLTVAAQGASSAGAQQKSLPPQQIQFARSGADRRWAVKLPMVSDIIYLEKSGLKYLILPGRNQYVELRPEEVGLSLGNMLTPSGIIERLRPRAQYESAGTESVNGRTANKFKFSGAADTKTQAGAVQAESFVYVDQATGLPLRADINLDATSGASARIAIETRDIQLTPDASLFEVPTKMKRVTTLEMKQQIQDFVNFVRAFLPMIQPAAPPPPPPAAANANRR